MSELRENVRIKSVGPEDCFYGASCFEDYRGLLGTFRVDKELDDGYVQGAFTPEESSGEKETFFFQARIEPAKRAQERARRLLVIRADISAVAEELEKAASEWNISLDHPDTGTISRRVDDFIVELEDIKDQLEDFTTGQKEA